MPRHVTFSSIAVSALLLALWLFPRFWYTKADNTLGRFWFREQTNVVGWTFTDVPVAKSAEAALVADELDNGEFRRDEKTVVRVFSAKRFTESGNDIGLFVHTPDRCWTETGWKMESASPDSLETTLHGIPLVLERRVFRSPQGAERELVYFGGLVGGQPLPYRLDHNLSVGMKHALQNAREKTGTGLRASDERFWGRVWDSFKARRPLLGAKQFIRISIPLGDVDMVEADKLLKDFLPLWLKRERMEQGVRSKE